MPKDKVNLRDILNSYKFEFDLLQKIPCSKGDNKMYNKMLKEGQQLPEGVFRYRNDVDEEYDKFYTVYESDLTQDEINEYLTYKKLSLLNTIKKCVVFFTALTIISLILYVLIILRNM